MNINRLSVKIKNNPSKVILQYLDLGRKDRFERILNGIYNFSEDEAERLLSETLSEFENRHKNFRELLSQNFNRLENQVNVKEGLSEAKKLLAGAYFSKEYSIEAAALFNPSIIPHPDQTGVKEGEMRFIISLRATGEGHISSIRFRSGIITKDNEVILDPDSKYCSLPTGGEILPGGEADSDYNIRFADDTELSERVIFPHSGFESMGMEDARFVRFFDEKEGVKYYGTYTAYNGRSYRTQLIETADFKEFVIRKMSGNGVKDKGMALFPEKINGKYAMISREDSENVFILFSDSVYNWEGAEKILVPELSWELVQMGNCGSPVKTDEGWILITHAVGAVRKYVMSACLLNLENPAKVTGRLKAPLISPNEEEREGYVPNVVYSCGSIIYNGRLVIPYAMSDAYSGFATAGLEELIKELKK